MIFLKRQKPLNCGAEVIRFRYKAKIPAYKRGFQGVVKVLISKDIMSVKIATPSARDDN